MNATLLLCPDCGAALARDRAASSTVEVLPLVWQRDTLPQYATRGCEIEHCTRCEWTRFVRWNGSSTPTTGDGR